MAIDSTSRIIPTEESHNLFVRAERLNELNSYLQFLKSHYDYEDEVALQMEVKSQWYHGEVHNTRKVD